ncbi:MAG: hypothetical protein VX185_13795 [Pseudomonadota bacterium]|nr:hypothetical protein [Pseudomonadota bacterium]
MPSIPASQFNSAQQPPNAAEAQQQSLIQQEPRIRKALPDPRTAPDTNHTGKAEPAEAVPPLADQQQLQKCLQELKDELGQPQPDLRLRQYIDAQSGKYFQSNDEFKARGSLTSFEVDLLLTEKAQAIEKQVANQINNILASYPNHIQEAAKRYTPLLLQLYTHHHHTLNSIDQLAFKSLRIFCAFANKSHSEHNSATGLYLAKNLQASPAGLFFYTMLVSGNSYDEFKTRAKEILNKPKDWQADHSDQCKAATMFLDFIKRVGDKSVWLHENITDKQLCFFNCPSAYNTELSFSTMNARFLQTLSDFSNTWLQHSTNRTIQQLMTDINTKQPLNATLDEHQQQLDEHLAFAQRFFHVPQPLQNIYNKLIPKDLRFDELISRADDFTADKLAKSGMMDLLVRKYESITNKPNYTTEDLLDKISDGIYFAAQKQNINTDNQDLYEMAKDLLAGKPVPIPITDEVTNDVAKLRPLQINTEGMTEPEKRAYIDKCLRNPEFVSRQFTTIEPNRNNELIRHTTSPEKSVLDTFGFSEPNSLGYTQLDYDINLNQSAFCRELVELPRPVTAEPAKPSAKQIMANNFKLLTDKATQQLGRATHALMQPFYDAPEPDDDDIIDDGLLDQPLLPDAHNKTPQLQATPQRKAIEYGSAQNTLDNSNEGKAESRLPRNKSLPVMSEALNEVAPPQKQPRAAKKLVKRQKPSHINSTDAVAKPNAVEHKIPRKKVQRTSDRSMSLATGLDSAKSLQPQTENTPLLSTVQNPSQIARNTSGERLMSTAQNAALYHLQTKIKRIISQIWQALSSVLSAPAAPIPQTYSDGYCSKVNLIHGSTFENGIKSSKKEPLNANAMDLITGHYKIIAQAPHKNPDQLWSHWHEIFKNAVDVMEITSPQLHEQPQDDPYGLSFIHEAMLKNGAPGIMIGQYHIKSIHEVAPQSIATDQVAERCFKLEVVDTNSGNAKSLHFRQISAAFHNKVLSAEALSAICNPATENLNPSWISSQCGQARPSAILTAQEITKLIQQGLIKDEKQLQDKIFQMVKRGRHIRGPNFIQSKEQLEQLLIFATQLLRDHAQGKSLSLPLNTTTLLQPEPLFKWLPLDQQPQGNQPVFQRSDMINSFQGIIEKLKAAASLESGSLT